MRKNATKLAAAVLSLAMVMTSVNMPASAAKTKVKLNKTKATLYVNGSASEKATTLKVTVNGKKVNATFKSSNTKVLTVAKSGKVTAKKNGTAKVTATYKKKKYNCTVTVKTYATSVSITSAKTLNLAAGKTATIKATVKPSTASNKKVSFTSSNKNVATVTSAGKVTAKKAGTATVTVKALGSKKAAKKATVKVNVKAAVKPSTEPTTTPTTEPTATPETPVATEGAITVTTNVTGASITVTSGSSVVATGTAVGTSFTTGKVANGTYTVKVSAPGYKDATKEVVVNDDVAINVELEKVSFEAAQVGRQTIKVTGDDLTDKVADYVVKRGNINVAIDNVKLADDKKSAVLTSSSSSLTADDNYTVSFKNGAEYKLSVVAEKTTKIDVKGNDLVLDATAKTGTIYFNVYNQFGERMQADIVTTCTIGTVSGTTSSSKTADTKLGVTLGTNLNVVGTKGILVLVDKNSGVTSGQIEVKVNSASKIAKIDVVGLYKKGVKPEEVKEIKKSATASDYALAFKAYDQYGKELSDSELAGWASDVTVSPAGVTGLTLGTSVSTISVGDNTYLALDLAGTITSAGTQMFTIVSNSIGLLGTTSIKVVEDVSVAKVKIAAIDTIYNGTKAEVSYTAVDTEGKEVTDYNTLNSLGTSIFGAAASSFTWERANDGKAKLYFTPSVTDITGSDTASQPVSVITTVGTSVEVTTFTVYNAKKVKALVGFTADTQLAALDNAKGSIAIAAKNFKVQDQYGNLLTTDEFVSLASTYKVKAALDGTNNGFANTYDTATELTISDADSAVFTLASDSKDTTGKVTKYKFTLYDAAGTTEIKGSDSTVSLRTVNIEDVTDFAVEKPATQFVENTADGKIKTAVDDIAIKVTGKAAGANVVIPATEYKVITAGRIAAGTTTGKIKVAADTAGVYAADGKSEGTVDETFEIVIGNKAGTSVKQTLTLSSIAKKVSSIKLKDNTKFALTKAKAAEVKISDLTGLLDVKDQYGTAKTANSTRVKFTNIPDGIKVTANNTSDAKLVLTDAAAKTYTVTVEYTADGVVYTDTLVLTVTA